MATQTILLALAEPQALVDVTQALGAEWETTTVASDVDALDQLEKRSFDALLVDFNLGSPDASDLLNLAEEKRPDTKRFLLAYEADLALVAAKVRGSHQILPKPIEPASVKSRIENAVADEDTDSSQPASETSTTADTTTAAPPVYAEVLKALELPEITRKEVGELVAQDEALTDELLRLTNSAYLGLPRNITDPVMAVESLGLDAVKAVVMALKFLAEHSHLKPGYLSFDKIWQHSTNVAQIARDLILFETKDRALASEAFVAGLLHDLGKVVLVTNFDDLYGRVHSLARKQPVPLWDIEKEMFGANHGEIGACLVGMWNMPSGVVEAVALHHEPPAGEHDQITALAAIHIANVLEHELRPGDECRVAPIIDTPFLNDLGLLQRLPIWRAAFANRAFPNPEPDAEPADVSKSGATVFTSRRPSRTANQLAAPATATRTTTSGQPEADGEPKPALAFGLPRRRWVYAGVAAGLLFLLALRLRTGSGLDEDAPVYARTPASRLRPLLRLLPLPRLSPLLTTCRKPL